MVRKHGKNDKVYIAGELYAEKTFGDNEETTILSSKEEFKNVYDKDGNIAESYYQNELSNQNIYDVYGNLVYSKEYIKDTEGTKHEIFHQYSYDKFGNLKESKSSQHHTNDEINFTITNEYNLNGKVENTTINIDNTPDPIFYDYSYDETPNSKLLGILLPNEFTQNLYYDKLQRVNKVMICDQNETFVHNKEFEFLKFGDHTSNLISKLKFADKEKVYENLTYKYDEKGNITEVRLNNDLIARYKYDALSRLVREDNKELSKTTTFEYDGGGNILQRREYPFTLVSNLEESNIPYIPFNYYYPISGWRDQLKEYNGQKFEYDNIGNPKVYRDVENILWSHGRQLDKFGNIADYQYNCEGIRTKKIVHLENCGCNNDPNKENVKCNECNETFSINYYLNGNKIIKQHDCCNDLTFYYGADGVIGFHITSENALYEDTKLDHDFFYKKNVQNDIIGIYDHNGELIIKYYYDAWGNQIAFNAKTNQPLDITTKTNYTNTGDIIQFIAIKNPFRYRSYYYDFETGLYYLNSRYYDPELGRFINADDIGALDVTKIAINGFNLYAYCLNNPVNEVDQTGYFLFWLFITAIVVGVVVGATTSIISQGITNGWDNINWWQVGWDALIGGVSGALSMSGLGAPMMGILGGAIGFISSVGSNLINGNDFTKWQTWLDIGLSTGLGLIFGFVGGAGATNAKGLDSAVRNSSQFMKAAASYDKVLTKIASGSYKSLAGAAGARALTRTTLQTTWQSIVKSKIIKDVFIGFAFTVGSGISSVFQAWILNTLS